MLARFDSPVSSHASLQSCDCVTRSTNSTSESWILGEVTEPAERLAGDLAGGGVVHGAAASTAAELRDELGGVCIGATMLGRPRALRQMRRRSLVDGGVERSGGEPRSELRLLYVPGPGPGPAASLGWSSLKGSCGGPAADGGRRSTRIGQVGMAGRRMWQMSLVVQSAGSSVRARSTS